MDTDQSMLTQAATAARENPLVGSFVVVLLVTLSLATICFSVGLVRWFLSVLDWTIREILSKYYLFLFGTADIRTKMIQTQTMRFKQRFSHLLGLFLNYAFRSGLFEEMSQGLMNFATVPLNVLLLWRLQNVMYPNDKKNTTYAKSTKEQEAARSTLPSMSMALRMMKMATTCYGGDVVAHVEMKDTTKSYWALMTKVASSSRHSLRRAFLIHNDHIQDSDLIHIWKEEEEKKNSTGFESDYICSHALVLDHTNKLVVLVISGTSTLMDIVIDVQGHAVPFCGGWAHWGLAEMAKSIWAKVDYIINDESKVPADYELIITGHSSGGMSAALLTVLILTENKLRCNRKVRCLAFGAAPTFYPLEKISHVLPHIIGYTVGEDALSMGGFHPMLRLNKQVQVVNDFRKHNMTVLETTRLLLGITPPPKALVEECWKMEHNYSRTTIRGSPPLQTLCSNLVWINKALSGESYDVLICDPERIRQRGIVLTPDFWWDHSQISYEQTFDALARQEEATINGTTTTTEQSRTKRNCLTKRQGGSLDRDDESSVPDVKVLGTVEDEDTTSDEDSSGGVQQQAEASASKMI